jgi:catechol 2,3-dioxygenase-like lactoylglutathione lyase family enzyme
MTNLPELKGVHHLKMPVSDLGASLDFYERALGARRIPEADHRWGDGSLFAYILAVPGLGTKLELRLHPQRAKSHAGFDPVTIAIEDRAALDEWIGYLDGVGVRHSPVITSIQAWIIVIEDPDGNRVRLYTLEKHGPELQPDHGSEWVKD